MSVVEAQVIAMRAQADAMAQGLAAFVCQCDAMLLMFRTMGSVAAASAAARSPLRSERPASPASDLPSRRTFGAKDAGAEDREAPPRPVEELTEAVRNTGATP
jgi:hypothetical protein